MKSFGAFRSSKASVLPCGLAVPIEELLSVAPCLRESQKASANKSWRASGRQRRFPIESQTRPPRELGRSPPRALTTGLNWSNHEGHEGHEDGILRAAESHGRLCDRDSLAPQAGTKRWPRTLLSLNPSCSSCASWYPDRREPFGFHGNIPRPWRICRSTVAGESRKRPADTGRALLMAGGRPGRWRSAAEVSGGSEIVRLRQIWPQARVVTHVCLR